jgi:phosphoenolpyruvate carboxykinase (GTP)
LWPGFGENSRVLKWVFDRLDGTADAVDSPIGRLPAPGAIDVDGLDIDRRDLDELLRLDTDGWRQAVPQIRDHYAQFGERLPVALTSSLDRLDASLS